VARADLLLRLVRAGQRGDAVQFRTAAEALVAEERSKHHHVLADRLEESLRENGTRSARALPSDPSVQDMLVEVHPRRRLDELLLPDEVRAAAVELVEEQLRADLLRAHNLEPRHRVLLAGPPGNGKTSLAEAVAEALMVPMYVVRYDGVIASYLGETAARLRVLLDYVRSRRCVLFFDEFDAIGKERGDIHETGEIKRVVSSLLMQLDALPSFVTVITASNHPELLDRAVWRRFQLRLALPQPTPAQLVAWFDQLRGDVGELGLSSSELSERLAGLSFAELEEFTLDIKRRLVLDEPDSATAADVVRDRLRQWQNRFSLARH
jgi:SpoVK/Ycf46/Vps4 family AAA+-type ATPase